MRIHGADDEAHISLPEAPVESRLEAKLVVRLYIVRDPTERLTPIVPFLDSEPAAVAGAMRFEKLSDTVANGIMAPTSALRRMLAHRMGHLEFLCKGLRQALNVAQLEGASRVEDLSDPYFVIVICIDAAMH